MQRWVVAQLLALMDGLKSRDVGALKITARHFSQAIHEVNGQAG